MSFPDQPTSFIGRENEIAEVLVAERRSRLITLTGPGGIGKTRLALEAARRLQERDEIVSVYIVDGSFRRAKRIRRPSRAAPSTGGSRPRACGARRRARQGRNGGRLARHLEAVNRHRPTTWL